MAANSAPWILAPSLAPKILAPSRPYNWACFLSLFVPSFSSLPFSPTLSHARHLPPSTLIILAVPRPADWFGALSRTGRRSHAPLPHP